VGNVAVVAQQSAVPVFSAVHTQWRRGPIGGVSARIDEHGRAAGQLARSLLEGAQADSIAIRSTPDVSCELDATAMERWGIPLLRAPASCTIANAPAARLKYFAWIAGLALLVLLEAALLWALWLQSRERRRAEAQLRERGAQLAQVSRISMIGALTASIAHEINQPMGAILSNTEAAEMMLERGELNSEKLREILRDIREEDLRASQVIASLRKLLARQEPRVTPTDVNTEVAEALRHVAFEAARKRVMLMPHFDRDTPPVLADPVQLQQVVINLAMNAIEAVSAEGDRSREVRVTTQARPDGVQIEVADRGPGLAAEDEGRLFESVFTRKKDGMGFGLSIVRAIVASFGGTIMHERNVPRGAVFRVWLPAMGR
jgi:signal transduction histidine kinase